MNKVLVLLTAVICLSTACDRDTASVTASTQDSQQTPAVLGNLAFSAITLTSDKFVSSPVEGNLNPNFPGAKLFLPSLKEFGINKFNFSGTYDSKGISAEYDGENWLNYLGAPITAIPLDLMNAQTPQVNLQFSDILIHEPMKYDVKDGLVINPFLGMSVLTIDVANLPWKKLPSEKNGKLVNMSIILKKMASEDVIATWQFFPKRISGQAEATAPSSLKLLSTPANLAAAVSVSLAYYDESGILQQNKQELGVLSSLITKH